MLRKEQEQEAMLAEKLAEQRYQLEQTEQLYIEKSAKLREMREAAQADGEGNADAMLKMLRSEVTKGRQQMERIKRDNEEKMHKLREIDSALSDPPVTKNDIDQLEEDIVAMQGEVQNLASTISEHNQDSRLAVYKQQANLVAKKKEVVFKDKKQLEEQRDVLAKDLSQKEREYEQMKGHKFMNRDEFKNYAASLRDKSAKFKRLKMELSELRHEGSVLLRTEQLLHVKDPTPEGLRDAEEALEKASIDKSQIDKAKGVTLDEISGIVGKINTQLKEKKNKLAPQIKMLRSVRQNFQQVEVKYLEKKSSYDQAKSTMDGELAKLAGEVKGLDNEVMEAEQSFHELNMHISTLDSRLTRVQREARCMRKEETFSPEFQTLQDQYQKHIASLDEQCKDLRKEQKTVKESHEDTLKQKMAFVQLEKLMQIKLKVSKQELMNSQYGGGMPTRTMMDHSPGVERLVIE